MLNHGARIVTDGLVLYLDAANPKSYPGSGTTILNLGLSDINFNLYNGASYQEYPSRFNFDGTDDNIGRSTPSELQIKNDKTIIIWWKHNSSGGDDTGTLIRVGLGTDLLYYLSSRRSTKRLAFQWYDNSFKTIYSSANGFALNSFNFGAAVINSTNCNFYINGISSGVGSVTTPTPTNANSIGIGASRSGSSVGSTGQDLCGDISTVQVYNRALTEAEIKQNFNALRGRYGV